MLNVRLKQLQEFEQAISQRDNLIEELTWSLQQALSVRDALASQLNSMNATEIPCKDNDSAAGDDNGLQVKVTFVLSDGKAQLNSWLILG